MTEEKMIRDLKKIKSVASDFAALTRYLLENNMFADETADKWARRVLSNYEKIRWKGSQGGRTKFITR